MKKYSELQDIRNKSSLFLQILLWLNTYLSLTWTLIYGYYICCNINKFGATQYALTLFCYTVAVFTECLRLYMGYSGNLRSKTTDLGVFLTLAPLVQLPVLLYLMLSAITYERVIRIISCILLIFMFVEFVVGIFTWRTLSYHQAKLYQLKLQMTLALQTNINKYS